MGVKVIKLAEFCRAQRYSIEHGMGEWYYDRRLDRWEWRQAMTSAQIEETRKQKEFQRAKRIQYEVLGSGIPAIYVDANLATNAQGKPMIVDAGNRRMLEYAAKYIASCPAGQMGMAVSGSVPGSGKTYPMCAIGRSIIEKGRVFRFVKVGAYLDMLRESYNAKGEVNERTRTTGQIMDEYLNADVLLLDDMGTEKLRGDSGGDWSRDKLFALIDGRLGAKRTTFATTNLTREDLDAHYGTRIASRLHELMAWVVVKGPDRRPADDPFASEEE